MNEAIRVQEAPSCLLCGTDGASLYSSLRDRLFDAPGEWHVKKCPNSACGLLWLDPMPSEEDVWKAYRNYYTHQEDKPLPPDTWPRRAYQDVKQGYLARKYGYYRETTPLWKRLMGFLLYLAPARRTYLDFNVMYLPAQPQGRLLDVGCGSGTQIEMMHSIGWSAEGVDHDAVAVKHARRKGLRVNLGTLEAQEYPEYHFDAVVMSHVIEHVHNPLRLMKECYRILKSGGRVVLVTPNGKSWGHRMFQDAWLGLDPPRHLHVFTPRSLCQLVERAGFQDLSVSTTVREADGVFVMSRAIRHTGKYIWSSPQSYSMRISAWGVQLAEWAALKVRPDTGEEIALLAAKL